MILFNLLFAIGKISHTESGDEKELMNRIKAKDTVAFGQLYDQYKSLLYGMIVSIVKGREEAEDVLQEVFLRIWEKAHLFDADRGHVYSWIVTLTRNQAIDRIRSKGYQTQPKDGESPAILQETNFDPLETTIFSDRSELVKKALNEIPAEQQEVIRIAYYRGMSQPEIAEHLNLPLGTVKTRTRLGMIKLKNILEEYISEHGE